MRIQLVPGEGRPEFLELPWETPLEEWNIERLVDVQRGIHRHVVRFAYIEGTIYALKELPPRLAQREYDLLRRLRREEMPVVEPVAVVADRVTPQGEAVDAVLITRWLDFSLPYRLVVRDRLLEDYWERLLDALAQLLVRLHLAGFFWGDCSLSNALFRRDAGALSAYLVDAETGELHADGLTNGQREHDLDIAEENVFGELLDLEAELGREAVADPAGTAADVRRRYDALWAELTDEEVFPASERYRLDERLRRLNELGYDVDEVELVSADGGYRLRLSSQVVEPGHHRRRLLRLTGLDAQENQARRLLNDIAAFGAREASEGRRALSETALAGRWLSEVFEPAIAAVPPELHGKRDAAEVFHEILDHRWYLSEKEGRDIGLMAAVRSYVESVLRRVPDERAALVARRDGLT